jgi:multiple sugar transport system substrate-binding protein
MEKRSLNRRDFLQLAGIAAASAVIASCAPAQTGSTGGEAPTVSAGQLTKEDISLRLWHWDDYMANGWRPILDKFTEKYPNIKVNIEMTDYGQYSQKAAASIAGGTVPDVVGTVGEHFTNMAGKNQLVDLKPYVEATKFPIDDFNVGNLSQCSWDGVLLAIPYTADGEWMFYQIEEFQKAGVKTPYEYWKEGNWTWDTVADLAKQLTTGTGVDKVFGWGGLGTGNYYEILPYMASNGVGMFDDSYSKSEMGSDKGQQLFQWGYDLREYAPGAEDQQSGTPQSGHVRMWIDWSPYGLVYADQMPFKYSYAPPPASPDTKKTVFCGDAAAFGFLKGGKHLDESWAVLEWLNQPDSLEYIFHQTGSEPGRMSVSMDEAMWKRDTKYPDSQIGYELTVARYKDGFYNIPKVSNFNEMWQAYSEEISLAWADSQPLSDALGKADERINALLPEATIDKDKLYWTF